MDKKGRYDLSTLAEGQFEPGSNDRVLKNRLGMKVPEVMDAAETQALEGATLAAIRTYDENHQFTAADIRKIHRGWLSDIYEWAGRYRQVNVSKDDFPFAAAAQIEPLMEQFERGELKHYTPCNFKGRIEVTHALAVTHVELILIHPFREGNGRLARLLATLMALQANLPLLDFRAITGENKSSYFSAVQAGMDRNYKPMEQLFAEIIEESVAGD